MRLYEETGDHKYCIAFVRMILEDGPFCPFLLCRWRWVIPSGCISASEFNFSFIFLSVILFEREQPIHLVHCVLHDPLHLLLCDVRVLGLASTGRAQFAGVHIFNRAIAEGENDGDLRDKIVLMASGTS